MIFSVVVRLTLELGRALHLSLLRLHRSLDRAMTASAVRRELDALPDSLLRDMGVTRNDIGYLARVLAKARYHRER